MYIMYNVLVDAAYTSVALAANLDWSRLCKQTQHSGSAEGTQARGHCAHFVTMCCMCASGKNRRRCVKQDHVALLFQATTVPAVPWPCTTGASTCASHCTSNSLRSPPAGQAPALYSTFLPACFRFSRRALCALDRNLYLLRSFPIQTSGRLRSVYVPLAR